MYEKRNREQERQEALRLKSAAAGMPPRCCAFAGCDQPGLYRAPVGRDNLRDYQWLCLEHIREFNKGWDFFKGMSQADIDRHRRDDVTWHRPTWRFNGSYGFGQTWRDLFELFGESEPPPKPRSKAEEMIERLGLTAGFTLAELKRRYKQLAKTHHPDLHGGDREAEERLKLINEAYTYLMEQRLYA